MKKKGKRKMFIALGIVIAVVIAVVIWFSIPFSPMKKQFAADIEQLTKEEKTSGEVFTQEDFSLFPTAIRNYISSCGYIGKPKMKYMKMEYHDVAFAQGKNGPKLKIDYTLYDFAAAPCRMALIDSSMFGVPFEGYDYYRDGTGGMKGMIAKGITLFDQTGAQMDKACLVTYLSESLFAPSILLGDNVTFEETSDHEVKATMTCGSLSASGIFTFNERYEMISFTTEDRAVSNNDGSFEYVPWSALCGEYALSDSGIKYPTQFKAVWNYPEGDFVYFDGEISGITYD